ncbi:hypothetical protein BD779DRAFT_427473 [Infundibulicybe gibba]|nr:hypothetical protein BD779DRAFT_427473 [Infundibulicybe gibba]
MGGHNHSHQPKSTSNRFRSSLSVLLLIILCCQIFCMSYACGQPCSWVCNQPGSLAKHRNRCTAFRESQSRAIEARQRNREKATNLTGRKIHIEGVCKGSYSRNKPIRERS